ncbi:MAG: glucose-1-phosphate adenylyltransferase [Planctomycetota bacterium]|nr:MAG: glucose-1-phosphate adenylyltransferase [Planctomycetota bacterium]
MTNTPVFILAGGKGSRLGPLTTHRAKPAVPFGGRYRIIDFVLSNFLNSGYRRVFVLTQYMAHSLIRHMTRNWSATSGMFLEVTPAQMRKGSFWYRGTADAVYQNLNLLAEAQSPNVAVFGGDHIYKFDVSQMEAFHEEVGADLTVAAFPVAREEASRFGVIQVDEQGRIVGFEEKPSDPKPIPGQPDTCLVSMGNYIFRTEVLEREAHWVVHEREDTSYDFGKDVVPHLVEGGAAVYAYDFRTNRIPGEPEDARPYWQDVGTIDSYYLTNMDIRSQLPALNLYNHRWRIRAAQRHYPPARFVRHGTLGAAEVVDTLICEGSIVSSATLHRVLLGYDCFVHAESVTRDSILLSGCNVGSGARLQRVLLDKNCAIEQDAVIGEDPEADRERFPFITERGVVVLPKGTQVPKEGPIRLTFDMAELLTNDPVTADTMRAFEGRYEILMRDRHSHMSSGPRYRRFGPTA